MTSASSWTFGVDEAGRGPILGPMVLAAVGLDECAAAKLEERGVTDSKTFGSGPRARDRRAELAEIIRATASSWTMRVADVDTIDAYTTRGQLNVLERELAADMLVELRAEAAKIICDGVVLFSPLARTFSQLVALNRAESHHVSVAAASILAKDERDRRFAAIAAAYEKDFGPLAGGGYLNAPTRRFLEAYWTRYGALPPEARRSWGGGLGLGELGDGASSRADR